MLIYKEMAWVEIIKALIQKYGRKKIFVLDRETALALQTAKDILNQLLKQHNYIRYIRKHT